MRVADYIMQKIVEVGVHHIFMVTGRGMLYLSDAAAKQDNLQCVSVHHEQAGAYACMAYAQYNETMGACLVSTGCAGTNALTSVLCAYQDEVPCIFISGQNTLKETIHHTHLDIRTYGQQEADIVSIVKPVTKYAVMIEDANTIAYEMDKAIYLAQEGRKGPVWIDVPLDIQNARIEPDELKHFVPGQEVKTEITSEVCSVVEDLNKSKRPVVLIGSAIRSARAIEDFKLFVEKTKIPVVYANSAVDVYGLDNELSIGVVSTMSANRCANFAIQNSDLILVFGNRLTSMTVGGDKDKFARNAKIIVVDIDEKEHQKNTVKIDSFIKADIKDFLVKINQKNLRESPLEWRDKCKHWKKIFPKCEENRKHKDPIDLYEVADVLSKTLPNDAVLVCDAGLEELIMPTTVAYKKGQRCLHPVCQGAMGYALPASYGAYLSSQKPVIAIIGDGSIMMNLQEFQTIVHHQYPVKIIVINNNCYAVIRKRQQDLFRTRTVGTDKDNGVSCPDYQKIADCFGLKYQKIDKSENLEDGLRLLMGTEGPVLCEIFTTAEQTFLHSSFARTKSGKFVQRPLEDQSPYLERALFLSEMVIEPIDQ